MIGRKCLHSFLRAARYAGVLGAWLFGAVLPAKAQDVCDTSIVVDFHAVPTDYLIYNFPAFIISGNATFADAPQWGVIIDGALQTTTGYAPFVQFPHPGPYLVCLTASVIDQQQHLCYTAHCEVTDIVAVQPNCHDSLIPDFTISLEGQVVTFIDQSISQIPIVSYGWTFGDGSPSQNSSASQFTHEFPGTGPYQVCMTVTNGDSCFAEVCKWLYFGPSDVPCDTILRPNVTHAEIGLTTALYDGSITSGMEHSTHWDLGDGTHAEGPAVFHTYQAAGEYPITATTQAWGPLNTDTCTHVSSFSVFVPSQLLGISESAAGPTLSAHPQPFSDAVTIDGATRGADWYLYDASGRALDSGRVPPNGSFTIPGSTLRSGVYLLRTVDGTRAAVLRLTRQ